MQIQYNLLMGNKHIPNGCLCRCGNTSQSRPLAGSEGCKYAFTFPCKSRLPWGSSHGDHGKVHLFLLGERLSIYQAAGDARQQIPNFRLLAGTGTPSLEDSVFLTRAVFDLGYDGVVVLPPYYFRRYPMRDYSLGLASLLKNQFRRMVLFGISHSTRHRYRFLITSIITFKRFLSEPIYGGKGFIR